jgi:hypothetical protein
MPVQIEIHESHIQSLVEFYALRLKALREEIAEREKETREINSLIQKLRRKGVPEPTTNGTLIPRVEYSETWPWAKKIAFAIELNNKPLTTKEIVDSLIDYESSFLFDRKRVVASISSVLSMKSGPDKDFIRTENDAGEFAYNINRPNQDQAKLINQVSIEDDGLPF